MLKYTQTHHDIINHTDMLMNISERADSYCFAQARDMLIIFSQLRHMLLPLRR